MEENELLGGREALLLMGSWVIEGMVLLGKHRPCNFTREEVGSASP